MTTTKHMRTVLAAAAAGALVLGSAGGAIAAPKAKPTQKLQSISIKGHAPLDLATVTTESVIKLRAKTLGTKVAGSTVAITLGVYEKKVGGTLAVVDSSITPPLTSESASVPLLMRETKAKKVAWYAADANITTIWTAPQIAALAAAVKANGKAYICIATADLVPTTDEAVSKGVKKRLGTAGKGKAVRDCVKVINSNDKS